MKRLFKILAFVLLAAPLCAQGLDLGVPDRNGRYYYKYSLYLNGTKARGDYSRLSLSEEGIVFARGVSDTDEDRVESIPPYRYFSAATGKELSFPAIAGQSVLKAGPFRDGRALLLPSGPESLYGYLAPDGSWAISPRYVQAGDFVDGYALVSDMANTQYVIDAAGTPVLTLSKAGVRYLRAGFALLSASRTYAFDLKNANRAGPDEVTGIVGLDPALGKRLGGARALLLTNGADYPRYAALGNVFLSDGRSLAAALNLKKGAYDDWTCSLEESFVKLTKTDSSAGAVRRRTAIVPYSGDLILPPESLVKDGAALGYLPGGYWTSTARAKWDDGESYYWHGENLSVYDRGGKPVAARLCNYIDGSEGSLAHLVFGNGYFALHDGAAGNYLHGLFDLASMKFVIEPRMTSLKRLEGTDLWLATSVDGAVRLFDQRKRAFLETRVPEGTLMMAGGTAFAASPEDGGRREFHGLSARVNADKVNLRSGPSAGAAVQCMVDSGRAGTLMEISPKYSIVGAYAGFWMRVRFPGEDGGAVLEGWMLSPFIDLHGYSPQ